MSTLKTLTLISALGLACAAVLLAQDTNSPPKRVLISSSASPPELTPPEPDTNAFPRQRPALSRPAQLDVVTPPPLGRLKFIVNTNALLQADDYFFNQMLAVHNNSHIYPTNEVDANGELTDRAKANIQVYEILKIIAAQRTNQ